MRLHVLLYEFVLFFNLKRQCHKRFYFRFFPQTASSGLIRGALGRFFFFAHFSRVNTPLCSSWCIQDSAVSATLHGRSGLRGVAYASAYAYAYSTVGIAHPVFCETPWCSLQRRVNCQTYEECLPQLLKQQSFKKQTAGVRETVSLNTPYSSQNIFLLASQVFRKSECRFKFVIMTLGKKWLLLIV